MLKRILIRLSLQYVCEEMGIALRNSAFSPNIKERMDHSCVILDHEARLIAQAEHIPVHLGSMALAAKEGLKRFRGKLKEGDVLCFNDPYVSGTHLPDLTLIAPVYFNDHLVAYVANKAHHTDVGGISPGSMSPDSSEIFQEGLIIPPVRLVKEGIMDEDLLNIMLSNVRVPSATKGDLMAQVAAIRLGRKRVLEILSKYGLKSFREAMEEELKYSERLAKAKISKLPEGSYKAEDYLEYPGRDDRLVKIQATITLAKDKMIVDYEGSDPQVEAPINSVMGVTVAGVYYVLKCIVDPEIPVNDGLFRVVEVKAPAGTVVNATPPAPVAGGNVETSQRNVDVLLKALSKAIPDRVCAGCQGTMNNIAMGGYDSKGRAWAYYETVGGGYGARKGMDGESGIQCHMTNTMNTPVEAIENELPLMIVRYMLREGSGGEGRWRGGMGIERVYMLTEGKAKVTVFGDRHKLRPWGLMGGKEGKAGEYLLVRKDGKVIKLDSKTTFRMNEGDMLVVRTPGGGGYGYASKHN